MAVRCFFSLFFALFVLCSGCSSGKDYWRNRWDDARDMITLTAGGGFGVKLFAFGLQLDSYNYAPAFGLQGGEFFKSAPHGESYHVCEGNIGIPLPCVAAEIFYPGERAARRGKAYCGGTILLPFFLRETAGLPSVWCNSCSWKRKFAKNRAWHEYVEKTPREKRLSRKAFLKTLRIDWESPEYGGPRRLKDHGRTNWSIYTDIHAVCALGGGLRIGFNPGEAADFLLGWCMIDIFRDDL